MEVASFSSSENASVMEAMAVDTLLASAGKSLALLLMATGSMLNHNLPNLTTIDERFPFEALHKKQKPVVENKDGSDTEDDGEDDDGDADDQDEDDDDDDAGDEDFSGEEGGEEEEDPVDNPEANGNAGSDDDDDDDEDGEEGEDGNDEDEEDEEDDDDEEVPQPPTKKRK